MSENKFKYLWALLNKKKEVLICKEERIAMQYRQKPIVNTTIIFLLLLIVFYVYVMRIFKDGSIPNSFLQLNTIFLSILIEAIPFVLVGVLIAGFIQIFVNEEHIRAWIPKSKVKAVLMSCVIG